MFGILGQPRDPVVTFAEPGEGRGFLQSIGDIFTDPEERDRLGRIFNASTRNQIVVDNTFAREAAIDEAIDKRIAEVRRATGVTVQDWRSQSATDVMRRDDLETLLASTPEERRSAFYKQLAELAERFPEARHIIRPDVPVEEDAKGLARAADTELRAASSDPRVGGVTGFGAHLAGGVWGSFRDPMQVASLFAGGGPGTLTNAALRIGQVAVREGLINAGTVAAMQPAVQAWREEVGLQSGVVPALENVAMAFLFGTIPGAAIQGGREIKGALRRSVERAMDGTATPKEMAEAGRALNVDSEVQRTLDSAAEAEAADAAAMAKPPQGVALDTDADLTVAAIRHAEDPVANPPPAVIVEQHALSPQAELNRFFNDQIGVDELSPRAKALYDAMSEQERLAAFDNIGRELGIREARDILDDDTVAALRGANSLAEERTIVADAMERAGTRNTIDQLRNGLNTESMRVFREQNAARGASTDAGESLVERLAEPKRAKNDPFDKVPAQREDGTVAMLSRAENAKAGERDGLFADLVRSCK